MLGRYPFPYVNSVLFVLDSTAKDSTDARDTGKGKPQSKQGFSFVEFLLFKQKIENNVLCFFELELLLLFDIFRARGVISFFPTFFKNSF